MDKRAPKFQLVDPTLSRRSGATLLLAKRGGFEAIGGSLLAVATPSDLSALAAAAVAVADWAGAALEPPEGGGGAGADVPAAAPLLVALDAGALVPPRLVFPTPRATPSLCVCAVPYPNDSSLFSSRCG